MPWLLRLYPRAWRERYEEELLAVLEDHQVTLATVLDLLIGAVDANFNYNRSTEGVQSMVNRLRSGTIMIFCAFMLFGVGWSMLQRLTDPMNQFEAVAKFHPAFEVFFVVDFIVGCLSFLAFVLGGLPVFFFSVKRAIANKQKNALLPLWIAVSCLLICGFATAILANWQHIGYALTHIYIFFAGYFLLFAVLLIVGTVAVSLMIARTNFELSELRYTRMPEIIILACMMVAVVCSTILIGLIATQAPQLLNTQDVNRQMFIAGISFMTLATIFASLGLKRGLVKGNDPLTDG